MLGVLLVAFAYGLHRSLARDRAFAGARWTMLAPALVAVFGLSSGVANGLLPCNPGCEFESVTGTMHNLTGLTGFIAATAAMFLFARVLKADPRWHRLHRLSLAIGVVALLSLIAWIAVGKIADVNSVDGALQRLFVGVWFTWILVMALWLLRRSGRSIPSGSLQFDGGPFSQPQGVR